LRTPPRSRGCVGAAHWAGAASTLALRSARHTAPARVKGQHYGSRVRSVPVSARPSAPGRRRAGARRARTSADSLAGTARSRALRRPARRRIFQSFPDPDHALRPARAAFFISRSAASGRSGCAGRGLRGGRCVGWRSGAATSVRGGCESGEPHGQHEKSRPGQSRRPPRGRDADTAPGGRERLGGRSGSRAAAADGCPSMRSISLRNEGPGA